MKCKIRWIDDQGNPTDDENDAVMLVRTKDRHQWIAGRQHHFTASQWFPICACHAKKLNEPGMEIWECKGLEVA